MTNLDDHIARVQALAEQFEVAGDEETFKTLDSAAHRMRMLRGALEVAIPRLEFEGANTPDPTLIAIIKSELE